jgi:hypothetical protein
VRDTQTIWSLDAGSTETANVIAPAVGTDTAAPSTSTTPPAMQSSAPEAAPVSSATSSTTGQAPAPAVGSGIRDMLFALLGAGIALLLALIFVVIPSRPTPGTPPGSSPSAG